MTLRKFERTEPIRQIPAPLRAAGMGFVSLLLAITGVWLVLDPVPVPRGDLRFDTQFYQQMRDLPQHPGYLRAQFFMRAGESIDFRIQAERTSSEELVAEEKMNVAVRRDDTPGRAGTRGRIENFFSNRAGEQETRAFDDCAFRFVQKDESSFELIADHQHVEARLLAPLFSIGMYQPTTLLPKRRLRSGEQWTRNVELTSRDNPGAYLRFESMISFDGIVDHNGTRMAQVSERFMGEAGGMLMPDEELYLVRRGFRGRAIYFFDPLTSELLGGFSRQTNWPEYLHVDDAESFQYDARTHASQTFMGDEFRILASFDAVRTSDPRQSR